MRNVLLCILMSFGFYVQSDCQVSINASGSVPHTSSMLDVESTTHGLLPPRMTSAQRDAIQNPAEGLLIYNTSSKCYNYFNGIAWQEWCGTCVPQPSSASAGSDQLNVALNNTFLMANSPSNGSGSWTIINGTGGLLANPADPSTAFSGNSGASYTLRWTITTNCGSSQDEVVISFANPTPPFVSCGDNLSATHTAGTVAPVSKTVVYGTVSYGGLCWITRNLGASTQAGSVSDGTESSAGWYWQFNQKRGIKHDGPNNGTNATPSNQMVAYAAINENSNWVLSNDPCRLLLGGNWRIPTLTEYNNAKNAGGWSTPTAAYNSPLKLHSGGMMMNMSTGEQDILIERGSWQDSGTTYVKITLYNSQSSHPLYGESTGYIEAVGGGYISMGNNSQLKTMALPLRCVF